MIIPICVRVFPKTRPLSLVALHNYASGPIVPSAGSLAFLNPSAAPATRPVELTVPIVVLRRAPAPQDAVVLVLEVRAVGRVFPI